MGEVLFNKLKENSTLQSPMHMNICKVAKLQQEKKKVAKPRKVSIRFLPTDNCNASVGC